MSPETPTPLEWRCFHCDEVFTDREAAKAHFGDMEDETACQIAAGDGGLVARVDRRRSPLVIIPLVGQSLVGVAMTWKRLAVILCFVPAALLIGALLVFAYTGRVLLTDGNRIGAQFCIAVVCGFAGAFLADECGWWRRSPTQERSR